MAQNRISPEHLQHTKALRQPKGPTPAMQTGPLRQKAPSIGIPARYDKFESSGESAVQLMIQVLAHTDAGNTDSVEETVRISEQGALLDPETGELIPIPEEAEDLEDVQEEDEEDVPGVREKDDAPQTGGPSANVLKTTVEEHCYCDGGSHDKMREGSEECYLVVTKVTDQQGNPVDSPERGKRKALNDLET